MTEWETLVAAIRAGDRDELDQLVQTGLDPYTEDGGAAGMPIVVAVWMDSKPMVATCLCTDGGTDMHGRGNLVALYWAVRQGNSEIASLLLDSSHAFVPEQLVNWRPPFAAIPARRLPHSRSARGEVLACLRLCVERRPETCWPVGQELPGLVYAAANDDVEVIGVLADGGAAVDAPDRSGKTALMSAARQGHLASVRALLELGASVHSRDLAGDSALDLARRGGYGAVVDLLRSDGESPLL